MTGLGWASSMYLESQCGRCFFFLLSSLFCLPHISCGSHPFLNPSPYGSYVKWCLSLQLQGCSKADHMLAGQLPADPRPPWWLVQEGHVMEANQSNKSWSGLDTKKMGGAGTKKN